MKRERLISSGLILLMVVCLTGGVLAAEKGVFKGIERFSGDTDGKRMFMEGANLEYFQGETYIRFAEAEIIEEEDGARIVTFRGKVALVHEDLKVSGESFRYHTEEKSGVFTGGVVLEREEVRNAQGEVEKDGIKLVCSSLYLQTKDKVFTATGDPFIEHKDFQGSGEEISYVDATETLTIKGGFHLRKEKEEIKGETISFDLKQKLFTAQRGGEPIEVIFEIEEKEEKPAGVENGGTPGEENKVDGGTPVSSGAEDEPGDVLEDPSGEETGGGEVRSTNEGEETGGVPEPAGVMAPPVKDG